MRVREAMISLTDHVTPDQSLRDASAIMKSLRLDPIPVVEADRVVGVLAESAVLAAVAAQGLAGGLHSVRDVMSSDIISCRPDMEASELLSKIESHGGERPGYYVPVVDEDMHLLGMVAIDTLESSVKPVGQPEKDAHDTLRRQQHTEDDEDGDASAQSFPASDPISPPSSLSPDDDD